MESPPSNSSLKFAVLLPFYFVFNFLGKKDGEWNWFFNATHYVRLPEELDEEAIERKLTQIVQKHPAPIWDLDSFKVRLQPITDLHHHGHRMSGVWKGLRPTTNPLYGYVLGGLSVLVLSASCLNYVLLYVARFNLRAKEFGLRQVLGANRITSLISYWLNALGTASWLAASAWLLRNWRQNPSKEFYKYGSLPRQTRFERSSSWGQWPALRVWQRPSTR